MKKLLILFLCLSFLLIGLIACNPSTNNPSESSTTTEQIEPEIPDDPRFIYEIIDGSAYITGFSGEGGDIVIPEKLGKCPVVEIVSFAFAKNKDITSVSYPGSIKVTGEFAFYSCTNLTNVTLGEGVTTISRGSFSECPLLSSVTIPSSVSEINDVAFQGDTILKEVTLPEGLTLLGTRAFANSGITSIIIPSTCVNLGEYIFDFATSLTKAEVKCVVESLPYGLFSNCFALVDVSLAEGIETLDSEVFFRCTSIERLVLPSTTVKLGERSLYGCTSLKALVFLSPNVNRFHKYAFHWLPALTDIYFAGTEETWNNIRKSSYNEELDDNHINVHFEAKETGDQAFYG